MFYSPMGMGPFQHPKQKPKDMPSAIWIVKSIIIVSLIMSSDLKRTSSLCFSILPVPLVPKHLQGTA